MRSFPPVALYSLLLLSFAISSCTKREDLSYDIGLSGPLLKTRIDITDIIADTFLSHDCLNQAYIDFSQEVFTLKQDTLLDMSQQLTSSRFSFPGTIIIQPGQTFFVSQDETALNFQDAEIRLVRVAEGTVTLQLQNPLPEAIVYRYTIPKSDKGGKPFAARVLVPPASGGLPGMVVWKGDFSGFTLDLTGSNGLSVNKIAIHISAMIDSSAQALQLTPFDTLKIDASFSELTLAEAYGYFGQHTISTGIQTINLKPFDFFTAGSLEIDSVIALLKISNGTGMDLRVNLRSICARNTKSNKEFHVTDPFIGVPVNIGRATLVQSTGAITPAEHEFLFEKQTMKSMVELLPDKIDYEIDLGINPLGNVSFGHDFFKTSSPLTARFELVMPLAFSAHDLAISKVVDFHFDLKEIREGKLYLIADNRFPFDASIIVRMMNKEGIVIDSLVPAGIVKAGHLLLPELIQPVRTVVTIPCDPVRIEKLKQTSRIGLDVVLNTKPAGSTVRLKSDYDLNIVISTHVQTLLYP